MSGTSTTESMPNGTTKSETKSTTESLKYITEKYKSLAMSQLKSSLQERFVRMALLHMFTHDPCPDGCSCSICLDDHIRENKLDITVQYYKYNHSSTKFDIDVISLFKDKHLVFTDCCPSFTVIIELSKVVRSITIIEHHSSKETLAVMDQYLSDRAIFKDCDVLIVFEPSHHNICASNMLFTLLNGNINVQVPNKEMPLWLQVINEGDTDLASKWSIERRAHHKFLTRDLTKLFELKCTDEKTAIAEGLKLVEEDRAKVVKILDSAKGPFTVVDSVEKQTSDFYSVDCDEPWLFRDISERFFRANFESNAIVILFMKQLLPDAINWSIRKSPNCPINLSIFATMISTRFNNKDIIKGGGHPNASGIQTTLNFNNIEMFALLFK